MHVATDIRREMFEVRREGAEISVEEVLPRWGPDDRLGIIIREPFGSLGASLLVQVAALMHYEVAPARRNDAPQYPQLFAFHIGGRFGDHSSFDIWPPRREVFLSADPREVLQAVVDRRITRLALPDIPPHDLEYVEAIASGWSDKAAFRETIRTSLAYACDGHVTGADVEISSFADELERMAVWALTPEDTYELYRRRSGKELVEEMQIGPSTEGDLLYWRDVLRSRIDEVSPAVRAQLLTARLESGAGRIQHFRTLSAAETLARL